MDKVAALIRQQVVITGVVQGVGFRPHVARVASRFPVTGLCGNDDNSVFIEVQGLPSDLQSFCDAVVEEIPPMASILSFHSTEVPIQEESGFHIVASRRAAGAITLIPGDGAVCADCIEDMEDPSNRRYQYPFTTCTNCGPRLSIIRDVPYDRPLTTMVDFPMCESCRKEYTDPEDRRYHAQPISCFDCGPTLWLEESHGLDSATPLRSAQNDREKDAQSDVGRDADSTVILREVAESRLSSERSSSFTEVITQAKSMLKQGKILAVKGIGGFTLMCDARNEEAVTTLRTRKRRPGKPLAVMAGSVEAASRIAELGEVHRRAFSGREAPIVLTPKAPTYDCAPSVAPGLDDVGVMLAYSPLHRLLIDEDEILVATSANSSSLPLTYRNEDARQDLGHIVDAFLMHDRGIHIPVEDSVIMADADQIRPIRRSRGFAPLPVFLGEQDHCVLAVGAELKNTFALTRDGMAFLSAHIGDMGSLETQAAYEKSVQQMIGAHRRQPSLVVIDKHPGYATHAWGIHKAEQWGVDVLEVQHHHAHALSLIAEVGHEAPSTFVVLDGTGYGDDATIWGGEILRLGENPLEYRRLDHLPEFWLPGGDSAVRHPWKSTLGLLWEYDIDPAKVQAWATGDLPGCPSVDDMALVNSQLQAQVNLTRTTSTGRLFDAAASLIGICHQVSYEAQAAMELEARALQCTHHHKVPCRSVEELVEFILDRVRKHTPVECLARSFHSGLAHLLATMVVTFTSGPEKIGFTGGVFANRLLSADLASHLQSQGYEAILHRVVPSNDGGLALGQALAGYLHLHINRTGMLA
jgi:hydrogenase maturation protein HypF